MSLLHVVFIFYHILKKLAVKNFTSVSSVLCSFKISIFKAYHGFYTVSNARMWITHQNYDKKSLALQANFSYFSMFKPSKYSTCSTIFLSLVTIRPGSFFIISIYSRLTLHTCRHEYSFFYTSLLTWLHLHCSFGLGILM